MQTSDDLIDIVFRAALCDHSAIGLWAQNLSTFRRMIGEEDYIRVKWCIGHIFTEGIDHV
jgi:hypothetical protein